MLNEELFEKINQFLQIVRRKKVPFGGMQMVLVGDPFQLCPVEGDYFFASPNYKDFTVHNLTTNMRQRGDPAFKDLLDRVRWGVCCDEDLMVLKQLQHTKFPDGIIPTKLYSKNISVDSINLLELNKLNSPQQDFEAFVNHDVAKKWMVANRIPEKIRLCVGAQVMCTKNIPILGLVNGSRGVITDLAPNHVSMKLLDGSIVKVPFVTIPFQLETIKLQYMPIKLAWAVTIHSAQGLTIDALEVDLGKDIFTWGQAYTGLSRATSLATVKVTSVLRTSFVTNPKVINFLSTQLKIENGS
jgi:ATP-dependent DNA helicase PIF1